MSVPPRPGCLPVTRRAVLACLAGMAGLPGTSSAAYEVTPWKGARTPVLGLTDADGRPWSLVRQRGRVVLVNFWASWCEPCRAEMPSLQALADTTEPERLAVVGINYQENTLRVKSFAERMGIRFPLLLDQDGGAARAWTRRIFPTTVLVGPDGRPRQVITGEMDWAGADARRLLDPLLAR